MTHTTEQLEAMVAAANARADQARDAALVEAAGTLEVQALDAEAQAKRFRGGSDPWADRTARSRALHNSADAFLAHVDTGVDPEPVEFAGLLSSSGLDRRTPMTPISPEAVAQMVADREAGTPGPWHFDGPVWNRIIWTDGENRLCFMAHSNGLNDDRDIANARRITRLPDLEAAYLTLAARVIALEAENAALRAEFELLTAVKDAHKMRGDNHWETLRSIRVLAQEGKLDHIIQHVNDAGAGYTQPDHVTMWELQSALAVANDRIATLRASEAAAMEALAELEAVACSYQAALLRQGIDGSKGPKE